MKNILRVSDAPSRHWVGDGFPVHGSFDYNEGAQERSPFLLLDYAAPTQFAPNESGTRRGVGAHPHRGFETVTVVYAGEVEHRDSAGGGGIIGPGDVQWMTAGSGLVHEEFHSPAYSKTGGPFEMVQLWVNLPAKDKMTAPAYQTLLSADIPVLPLSQASGAPDAGQVRVIAGEFAGRRGPARSFTPMNVWDLALVGGASVRLSQPAGWTTLLVVQAGSVQVNGDSLLRSVQVAQFSRAGSSFEVHASAPARLLLLGGAPINEPIVGYGPFVMNRKEEIVRAIEDYDNKRLGQLA